MKATILTYWATPVTGDLISGRPDESEADIPEGQHMAGDVIDVGDRRLVVVHRRNGRVVLRETRVHVPMEST
jgi:hypothetical protein